MENEYIQLISRFPSAWTGHGSFAAKLVKTFNPNVVVDLGVDYGFSTFSFAYPQIGKVYGIDWFQGDGHAGHRNTLEDVTNLYQELTNRFGVSNIEFIKSDFAEAATTWDKSIDILHIDGFHSYEAVKSDYENWIKFCTEESIILFHDTVYFSGTVGAFFDELEGFKLNRPNSFGLGVLTRSEKNYELIKRFIDE
jgi:predicted O-methyltransferase YrrM